MANSFSLLGCVNYVVPLHPSSKVNMLAGLFCDDSLSLSSHVLVEGVVFVVIAIERRGCRRRGAPLPRLAVQKEKENFALISNRGREDVVGLAEDGEVCLSRLLQLFLPSLPQMQKASKNDGKASSTTLLRVRIPF